MAVRGGTRTCVCWLCSTTRAGTVTVSMQAVLSDPFLNGIEILTFTTVCNLPPSLPLTRPHARARSSSRAGGALACAHFPGADSTADDRRADDAAADRAAFTRALSTDRRTDDVRAHNLYAH